MTKFVDEKIGCLSHKAEDHEKVYRYFNNCGVIKIATIASDLNDLRDERNDSDYDLKLHKFDGNYTTLMYSKARIAFNSFVSFTENSKNCRKIVAGIRLYKTTTNS
jgi:hypothetical protein